MGKATSSDDDVDDNAKMFFGEASKGITFVEFDTEMNNWMLSKFGLNLGEDMWRGELLDLSKMDLSIGMEMYAFEIYCRSIHQHVKTFVGFREAESVWWEPSFWTMAHQLRWRSDQYVKLYVRLMKKCRGEAKRQIEDFGHARMAEVRSHFVLRFGSAQRVEVKLRERQFSLGMPEAGQTVAFPKFYNMPVKLSTLEAEKTYFLKNCPIENRLTNYRRTCLSYGPNDISQSELFNYRLYGSKLIFRHLSLPSQKA